MVQRLSLAVILVPAFLALGASPGSAGLLKDHSPSKSEPGQSRCIDVAQMSGSRGRERAVLCRTDPPGRASGQGNTADTRVCIRPLPAGMPKAQANQRCDQAYGRLMRGLAATRALAFCRDRHKVRCERVNCETDCQLTPVVTRDAGLTYGAQDPDCPGTDPIAILFGWTASCKQGPIWFDCDCLCPRAEVGPN